MGIHMGVMDTPTRMKGRIMEDVVRRARGDNFRFEPWWMKDEESLEIITNA